MSHIVKRILSTVLPVVMGFAMIGIGFYFIGQTRTKFKAAVDASSRIWVLTQAIAARADTLMMAGSPEVYMETTKSMKELMYVLELRHLGLFRGNPNFSGDKGFASSIKTIYYAAPDRVVDQVRGFLQETHALLQTPYSRLKEKNSHLQYVKTSANGRLATALGGLVRSYKIRGEHKIYKMILALTAILLIIGILMFWGNIVWFPLENKNSGKGNPQKGGGDMVNGVIPILNRIPKLDRKKINDRLLKKLSGKKYREVPGYLSLKKIDASGEFS